MEIRKFATFIPCAILLVNILTGSVQAQSDPYKKEPIKLHLYGLIDDKIQPADKLRNHPDVIYAEIKVREAEADLNRVRQQVLAKIAVLDAEIKAAQGIFDEVRRRLRVLEQLRSSPGGEKFVSDHELADAKLAKSKFEGELLVKRSQLPFLLGIDATAKGIDEKTQPSLEDALAMALKKNSDIIQAQNKILETQVSLERILQQLNERILLTQAEVMATEKILDEAKRRLRVLEQLRGTAGGEKYVTEQELGDARIAVVKYECDLIVRKAALPYLFVVEAKNPPPTFSTPGFKVPAEKNPPDLRTYLIQDNSAEQLAKALQLSYKDRDDVRITPIGSTQIMVYAPADVQKAIARTVPFGPDLVDPHRVLVNAAKIQKALEAKVTVDFQKASLESILSIWQTQLEKEGVKGVNLVSGMEITISSAKLGEPVMLRSALQFLEDSNDIRFVIRDYGIIGMRSDRVPPEAFLLDYFFQPPPLQIKDKKK